MTEIVDGIPQPVVLTQEDIDVIGEIYVKATFFEVIGSGTTSGTVPKPAGGGADVSFVMDEWGTATDALVTTMDGGKPTYQSPVDGGGAPITTTFDTAGNFVFSATPVPAASHAVIFVYKCFLKNFNADESIFETEIGAGGDHGLLTGLGDDDHTQYLNAARAAIWFGLQDLADLGTKEHHDLDGLGDDDHTQYHTDARADAWFTGKDLADLGTKNHADLDLLGADDHAQYALLAGRSGGQVLRGGVDASDDLQLLSTAHATKGKVVVGDGGAGDSILEFFVNDALATMIGIDDSDSDAFKISGPAGFGNEDYIIIIPDNDMLIDVSAGGTPADLLVECGVDKTIELQTPVWDDINVGGLMLAGPPGLLPDIEEILDENGAATGIYTFGIAVAEAVGGVFELQHWYKEGTDVEPHIHFSINAAPSGTDYVNLELTYIFTRDGETVDPSTTISIEAAVDTQYQEYTFGFPTITGTALGIGDQFQFTVERVAAVGDVFLGDILIKTFGLHCEKDTMGSRQEYVK